MALKNQKVISLVFLLVVSIGLIAWYFVIIPSRERSQEYTGEITEVSEQWRWWSGRRDYLVRDHTNYNYYWHITTNEGLQHRVRVPFSRWKHGEEGLPVKKVQGERYPDIDTPEYREQQKRNREAQELLRQELFRSE